MTDSVITALTALTDPARDDLIFIGDTSETEDKKISHEDLMQLKAGATPTTTATGSLKLFSKTVGANEILFRKTINSVSAMQDALWSGQHSIILPSNTTGVSTVGCTVVSVGTVSNPTMTETHGRVLNFVSAATAAATAGTSMNAPSYIRGSGAGKHAGFFFTAQVVFPDASYNETGASTGSRIYVGLCNSTFSSGTVSSDDPASHHCAFIRHHVNGGNQHTNWQFMTKDNTTQNLVNTALAFTINKTYHCYIFCPPASSTIYWQIDNITDSTTASGSTTSNLPGSTTVLRAGIHLGTVDAVARNIQTKIIYGKSLVAE
ncbi:MAG: hypothetical protein V4629_03010 [Pseudomonadota bacterium]